MKNIFMVVITVILSYAGNLGAEDIYKGFDSTNALPLVGNRYELLGVIEAIKKQGASDEKYNWELYVDQTKSKSFGETLEELCPECIFVNPKPKPRPLVPCKKGIEEKYAAFDFRASMSDATVILSKSDSIGIEIDDEVQIRLLGYAASEETIKSIEEFCPECIGVDPKPLPKPIVLGPCK